MASTSALIAKEKGNSSFKSGDYAAAVGHYSTAILADATDFTLPLNRAAAYLKLGKCVDAERDCTTVLRLSPTNVKALFRRGQARIDIGKPAEAEKDLQQALQLEPTNEAVKQELQKVSQLIAKTKAAPRKIPISVSTPPLPVVDVTHTAEIAAAYPKRRRIPITIVESTLNTDSRPADSLTSSNDLLKPVTTRSLNPSDPMKTASVVSSQTSIPSASSSSAPTNTLSDTSKNNPSKPGTFRDAKQAREANKPSRVGGGIFKATGNYTLFEERVGTAPSTPSDAHPKSLALPNDIPAGTISPMTSFMFVRSWESLKDPLKQWKLLTQIPPDSLPSMFQNALEPHVLVSIVNTLQHVFYHFETVEKEETTEARRWVAAYVNGLARIPRFATLTMFMSSAEKATTRELLSGLTENGVEVQGWPSL